MPSAYWKSIALLALAAAGLGLRSLLDVAPTVRGWKGPAPSTVAPDRGVTLVAARPAEPTPLHFGWPSTGRVRVEGEHRFDGRESHESFVLEWRTLPDTSVLVEALPVPGRDYDSSEPGPTRTSGTLLTPVQALVTSDGRFLCTPGIDDLRAVWSRVPDVRMDAAVPEPLAERWEDWIGRWIGTRLAPGERRMVEVENADAEAWIGCTNLDVERVGLEFHLRRDSTPRSALAPGDASLARAVEMSCALEHTVEAELDPADMRPRRVRSCSRWTWRRGADVARVVERESLYTFDWTTEASYMPSEARSAELPASLASWAGREWPWMDPAERHADAEWWRALWAELSPPRRVQLLAGARSASSAFGRPHATRVDWCKLRPMLRSLWLGKDLTRTPRLPLRVWVENGPPESSVDVLFIGDGYPAEDLTPSGKYWIDVQRVATQLFEEAPLSWYRDWFNVRALFLESKESGCDVSKREHVTTALDVSSDDGRLRIGNTQALRDTLRNAGEADVVFVLVNSGDCAGTAVSISDPIAPKGLREVPTFTIGCHAPRQVAAHELGHTFAGLADEYVREESARAPPPSHLAAPNAKLASGPEPWEHFRALPGAETHAWSHEGAFYRAKGVFRPWPRCRMDDSSDPFCPVCCEALARAIYATCGLEWDDAAYHRAHPLSLWER